MAEDAVRNKIFEYKAVSKRPFSALSAVVYGVCSSTDIEQMPGICVDFGA